MRVIILLMVISNVVFAQKNEQQLAYQYFINGEYDKSVAIYEELIEKKFSVAYHIPYYTSLLKIKDYKKAENLALKVSKIYPTTISYQLEIGIAQEKAGFTKKAERTFNKIFLKFNGNKSKAINMANTFIRYEMFQEALEVYFLAEQLNSNSSFSKQKAQLFSYLGNPEMMLIEYLNALKKDPTQKTFVLSQIQKFLNNDGIKSDKNYQLVKKVVLPHVRDEKDRTDFTEILIWLFMQNNQFKMALRQAISIDKRNNSYGEKVYDLGSTFLDKEEYLLAVEAFDYIIKKGDRMPFFIDANINKLYSQTKLLMIDNKDLDEIDDAYKSTINILGINRMTVTLLLNYAHFKAFYLHDLLAAQDILTDAMNIPQVSSIDLAECKLEYADIQLLLGNIWESLLYYSQVEKQFKENPIGHEAKLRRAKIAYYQGDFNWAQAQLEVLKASTSKLIANDAMQLSLLITDNYNLDTSDIAMQYFSKADLLFYQQRYNEAIITYDSILFLFPAHSLSDEVYMRKAKIYTKMNHFDSVLTMYEKILVDWQNDILADDALYNLAKIYDDKLNNIEKAQELYERLILDYSSSIFAEESRKRYRLIRDRNLNIQ